MASLPGVPGRPLSPARRIWRPAAASPMATCRSSCLPRLLRFSSSFLLEREITQTCFCTSFQAACSSGAVLGSPGGMLPPKTRAWDRSSSPSCRSSRPDRQLFRQFISDISPTRLLLLLLLLLQAGQGSSRRDVRTGQALS